jgi:alpha-tubulin suppressor-like RCC1 family protein
VGIGGKGLLKGVKAVASDEGFGYCAVLDSGGVDCWGANQRGELGDGRPNGPDACMESGSSFPCSPTPVAVDGPAGSGHLGGVASVAADAGGSFCAGLVSGGVNCWGSNFAGQLGEGTNKGPQSCGGQESGTTAGAVVGTNGTGPLTGVSSVISDGFIGFCAVLSDGGMDCWGDNAQGQLGDGTTTGPDICFGDACSPTPVSVFGVGGTGVLTGVSSAISNLAVDNCAALRSGKVTCWGDNTAGELGDGTTVTSSVPAVVVR